jgi:intracellular multiplication protein IcmL
MNGNDALILIFSRNAFYKRLHFLALFAFLLSLFVIVFLILTFHYLYRNPTRPIYFATDNVGRLIYIVPVNTPNMSPAEVTAWTIEAVVAANSYDFINYRAQLQGAQKYFTEYGWNKYMQALRASNNLLGVINYKEIVTAEVVDQPKIVKQGILAGAYAWQYQMPLLITHSRPPYDGTDSYNNSYLVTVLVQRQPILQGNKGLGVVQLVRTWGRGDRRSPCT